VIRVCVREAIETAVHEESAAALGPADRTRARVRHPRRRKKPVGLLT
jgi:hypothetical protein